MNESYHKDWRYITLHISPDGKQVHCDGDQELRKIVMKLLEFAISLGIKFPLGEYKPVDGDC